MTTDRTAADAAEGLAIRLWNAADHDCTIDGEAILAALLAAPESDRRLLAAALVGDALNAAYRERNQAAQLAAALGDKGGWPVGWGVDPSEPDWPVLYIYLGSWGQLSWHMPRADVLEGLPDFTGTWDGTDRKPEIIAGFVKGRSS